MTALAYQINKHEMHNVRAGHLQSFVPQYLPRWASLGSTAYVRKRENFKCTDTEKNMGAINPYGVWDKFEIHSKHVFYISV